jgi:hypothetical protein
VERIPQQFQVLHIPKLLLELRCIYIWNEARVNGGCLSLILLFSEVSLGKGEAWGIFDVRKDRKFWSLLAVFHQTGFYPFPQKVKAIAVGNPIRQSMPVEQGGSDIEFGNNQVPADFKMDYFYSTAEGLASTICRSGPDADESSPAMRRRESSR